MSFHQDLTNAQDCDPTSKKKAAEKAQEDCKARGDRNKALILLFGHSPKLREEFLERNAYAIGGTAPDWFGKKSILLPGEVESLFNWLAFQGAARQGVLHLDLVLAFMYERVVRADVK